MKEKKILPVLSFFAFILTVGIPLCFGASEVPEKIENHGGEIAMVLGTLGLLLLLSKIGSLITRFGQPAVLGEILVGMVLGNLALFGVDFFRNLEHNEIITFLAEFGVVLLLFQIGLESNLRDIKKVGMKSMTVAIIGVVVPFAMGAYLSPFIFPGLSSITYLFIGASLTATSVGITARVFKDFDMLHIREAQIVLGAAVIDDVLGLLILAVISAIATVGFVGPAEVAMISAKAFGFLVLSVVLGNYLAKYFSRMLLKVYTGVGMKLTLALFFGLSFSYLASLVGLAPIVGAFVAGLFLTDVHFVGFKNYTLIKDIEAWLKAKQDDKLAKELKDLMKPHSHRHIEDLVENVGIVFVPLFFVYTGLQVRLESFLDPKILAIAFLLTVAAVIGKVVSGLCLSKEYDRLLVGLAMVPRGEVGLIFGNIGKSLGVIPEEVFTVIVVMVILTTLITPPVLSIVLRRQKNMIENLAPVPLK